MLQYFSHSSRALEYCGGVAEDYTLQLNLTNSRINIIHIYIYIIIFFNKVVSYSMNNQQLHKWGVYSNVMVNRYAVMQLQSP